MGNGFPFMDRPAAASDYADGYFRKPMARDCFTQEQREFACLLASAFRDAMKSEGVDGQTRIQPTVITLPPHTNAPLGAIPLLCEGHLILPGASGAAAAVGTAASACAAAEGSVDGLDLVVAATAVEETVVSYTVPKRFVAVIRAWGVEYGDLIGYEKSQVEALIDIGGKRGINATLLRGFRGSFENPFDVFYIVDSEQVVSIKASNKSTAMWHYVKAYFEGWIIEGSTSQITGEGGVASLLGLNGNNG